MQNRQDNFKFQVQYTDSANNGNAYYFKFLMQFARWQIFVLS